MRARQASIAAIGLLALGTAASAQDHRAAFTGYVASATYSDMASDAATPVLLAPGAFTGAQAELWFGRFGVRANGGYASTSLDGDPGTGFSLMAGDVDLMARLRWPRPGLFFQPYAVLGAGAVRYDLGTDATVVAGESYASDPTTRASLVLGIGTDLGRGPVAVRLELADIIGLSSPLSRADGSDYGPVQHVVLIFGLGFRAGRIALPARPASPARPPRTTVPPRTRPPRTTPPAVTPPPKRDPIATRPGDPPPRRFPAPRGDSARTSTPPPDTSTTLPPVDSVTPPPPPPPVDTTTTPPPPPPVDTTTTPPPPPVDSAYAKGRLFTVRVSWDPRSEVPGYRAAELAGALAAAGMPVWPSDGTLDDRGEVHQRLGAFKNAADARALGEHVRGTYDLAWEWVHIDKDVKVTVRAVEASHAFVDSLDAPKGGKPGSGRRRPGG